MGFCFYHNTKVLGPACRSCVVSNPLSRTEICFQELPLQHHKYYSRKFRQGGLKLINSWNLDMYCSYKRVDYH